MQDDKAIVGVVAVRNHTPDLIPFQHRDVGGIQKRVHINNIPNWHAFGMELGNLIEKVVKGPSLWRIAMGGFDHPDGSASEYDEYPLARAHAFITPN